MPNDQTQDSCNLTTTLGVTRHMQEAQTEQDWNSRCDQVKRANGGHYPSFWFNDVVLSGIAERTLGKIGKSAGISVTAVA